MTSLPTFDPGFSTVAMSEVWTATSRANAILEFEAALALALAETGLAPAEEAEAVAEACRQPLADPEAVLASAWEQGTPLLVIVDEVKARLGNEAQTRWVHYGATSQDALDTAQILQSRQGLTLLESSLIRIAYTMRGLVLAHREQPQIGRTFLQHATPTTFGMRVAMWLVPTLRHLEAMREVRSGLAVQLGGPVGTRADYGDVSEEVAEALGRKLGLASPSHAWHTDRSRIVDVIKAIEGPVGWLAKVAMDIALLAQSDTAEVTVRTGGSSSMAGKRNPIDPIRALAAADACRGAAAMITQARPHELDRALGSWQVEWLAVPLVFQTAAAACEAMEQALATLEVDGGRMASRVPPEQTAGSVGRQIDQVLSLFDQVVGTA
ncbi:MAG: lyase family protein [Acidimicrobiia bacterium]